MVPCHHPAAGPPAGQRSDDCHVCAVYCPLCPAWCGCARHQQAGGRRCLTIPWCSMLPHTTRAGQRSDLKAGLQSPAAAAASSTVTTHPEANTVTPDLAWSHSKADGVCCMAHAIIHMGSSFGANRHHAPSAWCTAARVVSQCPFNFSCHNHWF
jgi:hypothetical protein